MEPFIKDLSQRMGTVQSRITDFISVEASPVGNTSMSTTAPATIEPKEQNIRFESNKKEQKEGGAEEEKLEEVTEEERRVQELMSTKEDMSTSENNGLTIAPSVVQQNLVCKNDGRGHCGLHGSEMIKLNVSKQVWCDRGKAKGMDGGLRKFQSISVGTRRIYLKCPIFLPNLVIEQTVIHRQYRIPALG